jgi:hypothetical protein
MLIIYNSDYKYVTHYRRYSLYHDRTKAHSTASLQATARDFAEQKCVGYRTMADDFPGVIADIVAYRGDVGAGVPQEELGPRQDTKNNQYRIGFGYIAREVAGGRSVEDVLAHPPLRPEDMLPGDGLRVFPRP